MSADNWRECPACKVKAEAERQRRIDEAEKKYGKVSPKAFAALIAEANVEIEVDETLREDYQLGVYDGGEFSVDYRCCCQECDFEFSFKHKEQAVKGVAGG